jgi:hypothetical protein
MFNSLDDEIKRDEAAVTTPASRWLRTIAVFVAAVLLFGGLYIGIRLLE